jgi:ligand-binding SRPBCC domain-containing protein
MAPPAYFQDTMIQGAFRFMKHDHFFRTLSTGKTEMKDVFCFAAPLPVVGRLVEIVLLRRYMRNLLHERNVVLKQIAESSDWQTYLPDRPSPDHSDAS